MIILGMNQHHLNLNMKIMELDIGTASQQQGSVFAKNTYIGLREDRGRLFLIDIIKIFHSRLMEKKK